MEVGCSNFLLPATWVLGIELRLPCLIASVFAPRASPQPATSFSCVHGAKRWLCPFLGGQDALGPWSCSDRDTTFMMASLSLTDG